MALHETPVLFNCAEDTLVGVLHHGQQTEQDIAVLIVVGGPQYRVGSHRQFLLLARFLAQHGYCVFRFDYRGMGDSSGAYQGFETIDQDIAVAIDELYRRVPRLQGVVIWGLCDAAAAALVYANNDTRVVGLVLLNPWVRTEQGEAKAMVKHYYRQRLLDPTFWKKIVRMRWNPVQSISSLIAAVRTSVGPRSSALKTSSASLPLPDRLLLSWERFKQPKLLILSGNDYVAHEFRDMVAAQPSWQAVLSHSSTQQIEFAQANHTFSSSGWRDQVAQWTLQWLDEQSGQFSK